MNTLVNENIHMYLRISSLLYSSQNVTLNFQGIRRIQISCKLQEAATKYQYEGFSRIYIACASTNTQKFIDMLESMFGDFDPDDLDPQQLETDATKTLCQEA